MPSVLTKSMKITKKPRNSGLGMRSFACGGCSKTYKSYPALYLHIKRKHNGIKPPNTVTMKSLDSPNEAPVQTGRPHKVIFQSISCTYKLFSQHTISTMSQMWKQSSK